MDPQDVKVLDARIERVARAAAAAVLQGVAAAVEAGASPEVTARLLRQLAIDFEHGGAALDAPVSLALRVEGDVVDEAPEEGAGDEEKAELSVEGIDAGEWGARAVLKPADAEAFSSEMVAWLDEFDDRIRMSPHFVVAVNEAAENELPLTQRTAQVVYARVGELRDQAERSGS